MRWSRAALLQGEEREGDEREATGGPHPRGRPTSGPDDATQTTERPDYNSAGLLLPRARRPMDTDFCGPAMVWDYWVCVCVSVVILCKISVRQKEIVINRNLTFLWMCVTIHLGFFRNLMEFFLFDWWILNLSIWGSRDGFPIVMRLVVIRDPNYGVTKFLVDTVFLRGCDLSSQLSNKFVLNSFIWISVSRGFVVFS